MRGVVAGALRSPSAQFRPNPNVPNTFRGVSDLGRSIGMKSQGVVRVVVGFDGGIINALPVNVK